MRALVFAVVFVGACTDIDSVTGDVIGLDFGRVYDCNMTVSSALTVTKYTYHPCLVNDDDVRAYEKAWVDDTCAPAIGAAGGDCSGECHLSALGLEVCTL
jgi:hypothetical protein